MDCFYLQCPFDDPSQATGHPHKYTQFVTLYQNELQYSPKMVCKNVAESAGAFYSGLVNTFCYLTDKVAQHFKGVK